LEDNLQNIPQQYEDILQAVANGDITPTEGESLATIVAMQGRAFETGELDRRLTLLEEVAPEVASRLQADAKSLSNGTAQTALDQYRKEHPPQS
jgi:hypothetical protein